MPAKVSQKESLLEKGKSKSKRKPRQKAKTTKKKKERKKAFSFRNPVYISFSVSVN